MRYIIARRPWPFDMPLQRPWGLYRVAAGIPDVEGLGKDVAQASREDSKAIGFYLTADDAQAASPKLAEVRE